MSKRKCYLCGLDPAAGFASSWTAAEGERWYCHGDDDESPTCYERQGQAGIHELSGVWAEFGFTLDDWLEDR